MLHFYTKQTIIKAIKMIVMNSKMKSKIKKTHKNWLDWEDSRQMGFLFKLGFSQSIYIPALTLFDT